jgi:hypothetical protein
MMSFLHFWHIAGKHHKAMWCNGHKFHINFLDETKKTFDYGITAVFEVMNVSSRSDRHLELSQNRYYGYLEDTIEWNILVLFIVKLM